MIAHFSPLRIKSGALSLKVELQVDTGRPSPVLLDGVYLYSGGLSPETIGAAHVPFAGVES